MKEKKSSYFTATWKMLAAVLIGGIAGGVSVVIYELMKKGIDVGIRTINGTIQQYIFPVLIVIAVVTVVVGEYSLHRLKNVYKEMNEADEDRFCELDYEEEKWYENAAKYLDKRLSIEDVLNYGMMQGLVGIGIFLLFWELERDKDTK